MWHLQSTREASFSFIPQIALSYRCSCFKYRGEGSQIFWIRFGGAVGFVLGGGAAGQGVVRGIA